MSTNKEVLKRITALYRKVEEARENGKPVTLTDMQVKTAAAALKVYEAEVRDFILKNTEGHCTECGGTDFVESGPCNCCHGGHLICDDCGELA